MYSGLKKKKNFKLKLYKRQLFIDVFWLHKLYHTFSAILHFQVTGLQLSMNSQRKKQKDLYNSPSKVFFIFFYFEIVELKGNWVQMYKGGITNKYIHC